MKKILVALFLITDLYGLDSEKLLYPKQLMQQKNLTENQVSQMYESFTNALNENISDWDKYSNAPEGSKEREELSQVCSKSYQQGLKYLTEEVDLISRIPDSQDLKNRQSKELENIQKFANALNISSDNLEIRIIDPQSYISGIYLPSERRDYFLNWLNADSEKDKELFEGHISKIDFPNKFYLAGGTMVDIKSESKQNELFRKKILKMIIDYSEKSKIFRELMICFLANIEATQSVNSRYAYGPISNSILEGNISCHCRQGIALSEKELEKGAFQTYFKSNQAITLFPQGYYGFLFPLSSAFFHECGHALDFFSRAFDEYKANLSLTDTTKFFNISVDKEEYKKQKSKQKQEMEKDPQALSTANILTGKEFKSIDEYLEYEEQNLDNPIVQTKILMENASEIWQIFGVSLLAHTSKKVLYINYMSDFALSLEQKHPLRMSHIGAELPIDEERMTTPAFIHCKLPVEVYGSLMQVHGTNLSAYLLQLQYPYGLSSLLQNEYRLLPKKMKHLKRIKSSK